MFHLSTNQILGVKTIKENRYPPKIEKTMDTISSLPRKKKEQLLNVIDALIK